ncbi:MAG: N-acetylneuraminate synthase family protein [Treponemataceae bacterium]|nr:N-acetylneuraminate synthase family protein [Treponemataceae bacterium]
MGFVIAEIGTAHGGSEDAAVRLIDAAAAAGADAVKFQWVYADEILHPETGVVPLPGGDVRLYDRFRSLECPPSFFKKLRSYARQKGVAFVCSPFGLRSLSELLEIEPDYVKIASPELNHLPLLRAVQEARSSRRKSGGDIPVIISSGVSRLSDIEAALDILGTDGVTLLHCVTSYPAPAEEYNLRLLESLSRMFGVAVGVSDHSLDPVLVPSLAALCGASVIEKHITLSRADSGLDDPVALEPEQFALMVRSVRQCGAALARYGAERGREAVLRQLYDSFGQEAVDAALGDGVKRLAPSEAANYGRTNRSLHFMRGMDAGETVRASDIAVLRTEKKLSPGLPPSFAELLAGARLARSVSDGDGVQLSDFLFR